MKATRVWGLAPLAAAALAVLVPAQAMAEGTWYKAPMIGVWDDTLSMQPTTSNSTAVTNWRLNPNAAFNGVEAAFNGTARLLFNVAGSGGTFVCSGSLMPGGEWILTAAHCADDTISMTVQFGLFNGVALETRTATEFVVHPGWIAGGGTLDDGSDIALVRLNVPVTNLNAYYLSTTNDVGKEYLITGYGSTNTGFATGGSNWGDSAYGHYGYNVADGESSVIFGTWGAGTYTPPTYGVTYVSDFDSHNIADPGRYNTLQRMADIRGSSAWSSGLSLGEREAIIAGGDSGGADFIWDAANGAWLISAVHSWGWQFCPGRITDPSCDYRTGNSVSYGDITGSTAVFTHIDWIESVTGVSVTVPAIPEPSTYALMALGLLAVGAAARRRRSVE